MDLAPSASIIGASIAYLISERKRRLVEREWRRQLNSQRQIELSHALVNDVLAFMPATTDSARKVRDYIRSQRLSSHNGGDVVLTPEAAAQAIRAEVIQLHEKLEFELLRPLEVKIDFVDGHHVWDREAAKCRAQLDRVELAMTGLVGDCADPGMSYEDKQERLAQAIPLLSASEPIGGYIDSTYSAVIGLAKNLRSGCLAMQPA